MHEAKLAGVPTPFIYMIDIEATTIVMQYVEGLRARESLDSISSNERIQLCEHIGVLIGRLHRKGIVHGDLTTSNMIIKGNSYVFLIDFGLAEYSEELEKRGVDILLMRRSLQATHYQYARECFDGVIRGYVNEMGYEATKEVLKRVEEIAKRGRYAIEK